MKKIVINLNPAEKDRIKKASRKVGLLPTSFVRNAAILEVNKILGDVQDKEQQTPELPQIYKRGGQRE